MKRFPDNKFIRGTDEYRYDPGSDEVFTTGLFEVRAMPSIRLIRLEYICSKPVEFTFDEARRIAEAILKAVEVKI